MTGYQLLSRRDVSEYRVSATHLRHERTGCEVLHLASDDTENLFAFCFATPPRDDTGVSHILEHSVLSGSKRFPLKEPFSALLKSSLKTFLNALTYPDRTVYPGASCTRADFFNLLSVYGDAVFFPLLRRETFMQEAWRLEPAGEEAGAGLQYAGVVYNEMKGAYSSPDSIVGEWMYRSLFPDTPYRYDSGGDPEAHPVAHPRGPARVPRPLLPSLQLQDLPLRRHPARGHPGRDRSAVPVEVHRCRRRLLDPPAAEVEVPAEAREDFSRAA